MVISHEEPNKINGDPLTWNGAPQLSHSVSLFFVMWRCHDGTLWSQRNRLVLDSLFSEFPVFNLPCVWISVYHSATKTWWITEVTLGSIGCPKMQMARPNSRYITPLYEQRLCLLWFTVSGLPNEWNGVGTQQATRQLMLTMQKDASVDINRGYLLW